MATTTIAKVVIYASQQQFIIYMKDNFHKTIVEQLDEWQEGTAKLVGWYVEYGDDWILDDSRITKFAKGLGIISTYCIAEEKETLKI